MDWKILWLKKQKQSNKQTKKTQTKRKKTQSSKKSESTTGGLRVSDLDPRSSASDKYLKVWEPDDKRPPDLTPQVTKGRWAV